MEILISILVGIVFFCGFGLGSNWKKFSRKNKALGSVIIDDADNEPPCLYLELDDDDWYETLVKKDEVYFRVLVRK